MKQLRRALSLAWKAMRLYSLIDLVRDHFDDFL